MSQNSEQIEAKLCAYLEGELDETGRAEIEKHLQQNPPHRKLLAEVGKTRDLLRALPREPAPPDICEAFQGQLERSVLLADLDDEGATASMKINRWRQYLAVAAVVMLAAGLGLVVYFGLPSGTDDRNFVVGGGGGPSGTGGATEDGAADRSIVPPSDTPSVARNLAESVADPSPDAGRGAAATQNGQPGLPDQLAKRSVSEAVPSMQPPAASAPAAAPREELDVLARRVQGSWEARERERLFLPAGGAEAQATLKALEDVHASALCYVVTSAQPDAAAERIGQELSKLQVAWSAVPRPDPAALRQKLQEGESPPETPAAPDPRATRAHVLPERGEADGSSLGRATPTSPEGSAAVRGAGSEPAARAEPGAGDPDRPKEDAAAGATVAGPVAEGRPAPGQPADEIAAVVQEEAPADAKSAAPNSGYAIRGGDLGRPETLIVARSLTREQADALRASLVAGEGQSQFYGALVGVDRRGGAAETEVAQGAPVEANRLLRTRGRGGPAATAPADDGVIRTGDALRVAVGGADGDQTVAEVRVGQDGSVMVPGIGSFQGAGLTVAQLQDRLSAAPGGTVGGDTRRLEVSRVEKAKGEAVASPAEGEALAVVPEADVAQRGVRRARTDMNVRARSATGPEAPAPTAAAATPPAPAPATPSPQYTEARGGVDAGTGPGGVPGLAGRVPERNASRFARDATATPDEPVASGPATAPNSAGEFALTGEAPPPASRPAVGPVSADERYDVVIVVRGDTPDAAAATPLAAGIDAGMPNEPGTSISKYEILVIQFGEAESDSANVRVGEDGTVELPRIGRIQAEGLTAEDLERRIAAKLSVRAADARAAEVTVKRLNTAADEDVATPTETSGDLPPATRDAAPPPAVEPSAPAQPDAGESVPPAAPPRD